MDKGPKKSQNLGSLIVQHAKAGFKVPAGIWFGAPGALKGLLFGSGCYPSVALRQVWISAPKLYSEQSETSSTKGKERNK